VLIFKVLIICQRFFSEILKILEKRQFFTSKTRYNFSIFAITYQTKKVVEFS